MRRKVNRDEVAQELLPGESKALLQELHLLTRDGDLNADSLRKLKQVNHLVRLLAPALDDVLSRFGDPVLVDCGSGKGYLGFILYELFLGPAGKGTLLGIESRPELARAAAERAARLGYERMRFLRRRGRRGAAVPPRVHLVTALHACDTATDDALVLAVRHGADHVAVVPCCQAEVARQLAERRGADPAARRAAPPPLAPARVRLAPHQRDPGARARGARLPGHRDRAGRLGALAQERAHPGEEDPRRVAPGAGAARGAPRGGRGAAEAGAGALGPGPDGPGIGPGRRPREEALPRPGPSCLSGGCGYSSRMPPSSRVAQALAAALLLSVAACKGGCARPAAAPASRGHRRPRRGPRRAGRDPRPGGPAPALPGRRGREDARLPRRGAGRPRRPGEEGAAPRGGPPLRPARPDGGRAGGLRERQGNKARAEALAPSGVVSQQELQNAQSAYAAAQANLQAIATRLGETRIESPIDGVVSQRRLDPGALVGPNAGTGAILTVQRSDILRVFVPVNEKDAPAVRLGQAATRRVRRPAGQALHRQGGAPLPGLRPGRPHRGRRGAPRQPGRAAPRDVRPRHAGHRRSTPPRWWSRSGRCRSPTAATTPTWCRARR